MSDTMFSATFAPANTHAVAPLRDGLGKTGRVLAALAEGIETYSVIEFSVIAVALTCGTAFVAAAFGFSL